MPPAHTLEFLLQFTVPDGDEREHQYTAIPTPAEEGMGISMRLMGMVSAPSLSALGGVMVPILLRARGSSVVDLLDDPDLLGNVVNALQSADLATTGAAVSALLQDPKNVQFLRTTLFRTVHRDGKSLADAVEFNAAFTRNYGELYAALWEVIRLNGFFALPSTWVSAAKKLRAELDQATSASPTDAPTG